MPSPYSEDLRKRVMEKVLEGKTKLKEIAKIFSLSEKTIYLWRMEHKKNNNFKAKEGYQNGHSHIFTDLEHFKRIVEENNFKTAEEIQAFFKKGSITTILRCLKKINYVKKKPRNDTKSKIQ